MRWLLVGVCGLALVHLSASLPEAGRITQMPRFLGVMAGRTVEIHCSCPQPPPLLVDWVWTPDSDLEAEEPVTPEKVLMNRQTGRPIATLVLLHVTPEASGVYYCKVNGTRGPGTGLQVVRPINIHKAEYRSRMKDALIFLQAVMLAICVAAPLLRRYTLIKKEDVIYEDPPQDHIYEGLMVETSSLPEAGRITQMPRFLGVAVGHTVDIHCRFPQRPPLSVDWVWTPDSDLEAEEPVTPKPKVLLMEGQTGRPIATLVLLDVTPEASGVYYCKVNGTRGPGTGLEVVRPINIHKAEYRSRMKDALIFLQAVMLAICVAAPLLRRYTLIKKEDVIYEDPPQDHIYEGLMLETCEGALYEELSAYAQASGLWTGFASLTEAGHITQMPRFLGVKAGRTVVIHCRFPQRPPLSVDWVRTPDSDLEAEEPVTPKPKVVMEEQTGRPIATLVLLDVTPEASGVYYCKVNGTRGPGTGLEVVRPINIHKAEYRSRMKDALIFLQAVMLAICVAAPLLRRYTLIKKEDLIYEDMPQDHIYEVCASLLEAGHITQMPRFLGVKAGRTVVIHCRFPQRPPLSVDWVRTPDLDLESEEPVTPKPKVVMEEQTGRPIATLVLLDVTPEASGVYYCKVNGTRGPGTGLEVVRPINIHKAEYRSRMKDALIFLQAVMLAICVAAPLLRRYTLIKKEDVIYEDPQQKHIFEGLEVETCEGALIENIYTYAPQISTARVPWEK
ncbi:B-cell antigen receptor complex-associated protein beta chain [Merluccius polli]|uniref:B-cell antigen receptor complex-associated protein beta chain n=1 Tax=Merluccius polli TaxID=89951 RepID=A0AA47PBT0_MERPO|nr:B-cell antigen receptor complex-associated protein beta chain [Merluccius polli]